MNRAIRRQHRERLKSKRRYHLGKDLTDRPELISKAVDTPTGCSCSCCGNVRNNDWLPKHEKLTKQERVAILNEQEFMEELDTELDKELEEYISTE